MGTAKKRCAHVEDGKTKATVSIRMRGIAGSPTTASDLDTDTEVCTVCAAVVINAVTRAETQGLGYREAQ